MPVLGIGIDILHLPRLYALVHRRGNTLALTTTKIASSGGTPDRGQLLGQDKLARRILGDDEYKEFLALPTGEEDGDEATHAKRMQYLAVRWTAKEAAFKALYPHTKLSWKDVQVLKRQRQDGDGLGRPLVVPKPNIILSSAKHSATLASLNAEALSLHLSVSHDGDYVASVVLAETR